MGLLLETGSIDRTVHSGRRGTWPAKTWRTRAQGFGCTAGRV